MPLRSIRVPAGLIAAAMLFAACGGTTPGLPSGTSGANVPGTSAGSVPPPSAAPATLPPSVQLVTTLDFRPSGITIVDDELWAEDHARTNQFYAFDPVGLKVVATFPASRPCDLVAAGDRVWMVDLDAGKLLGVDPATHQVVKTIDGKFQMACGPQVAGGAVWFAANPGFARVDVTTGKYRVIETGDGTFPAAGVTPSGTSIWGVKFSSSELVKIDVTTGAVQATVPPPGHSSEELPALVAFDSLWVGNGLLSKVYRLDPETAAINAEIDTAKPSRLIATDDSVWLSSYIGGMVQRIDPGTNKVVFSVKLGGNINGITAGMGSVWAVDTSSGKLYRIEPTATGTFE